MACCGTPSSIIEFDLKSGKVIRVIPLPGKGYKTIVKPDGHLLASTGESASIVELDAAGTIITTIGGKADFPQLGLDFFSGFELCSNGNVLVANWLGHGKQGTGPHLVEFDSANHLVWSWADHQAARQVTNVLLLNEVVAGPSPAIQVRIDNFLVSPSTGPVTHVTVRNSAPSEFKGTLRAQFPAGWKVTPTQHELILKAGATQRLAFAIESGADTALNTYPITVTIEGYGNTVEIKQIVPCASSPYFKPAIDGDLADWKDAIPITLHTAGKATVVRSYWNKKQYCLAVEVEEDALVGLEQKTLNQGADALLFALGPAIPPQSGATTVCYEFLAVSSTASPDGGKCYWRQRGAQQNLPPPMDTDLCAAVKVAVKRVGGRTIYELAIPLQLLPELRPDAGREYSFGLLVNDADGTGIRDLGTAMNPWLASAARSNPWGNWELIRWGNYTTVSDRFEFGFCSSIH